MIARRAVFDGESWRPAIKTARGADVRPEEPTTKISNTACYVQKGVKLVLER